MRNASTSNLLSLDTNVNDSTSAIALVAEHAALRSVSFAAGDVQLPARSRRRRERVGNASFAVENDADRAALADDDLRLAAAARPARDTAARGRAPAR